MMLLQLYEINKNIKLRKNALKKLKLRIELLNKNSIDYEIVDKILELKRQQVIHRKQLSLLLKKRATVIKNIKKSIW